VRIDQPEGWVLLDHLRLDTATPVLVLAHHHIPEGVCREPVPLAQQRHQCGHRKVPVPDDRIDRTVDGIEHPLRRNKRSTEGEHPAVQFLHAQHLMKPVPPGVGHGLQDPPVTLVKAENKDVLARGGGCPGVVPRRHRRPRTPGPAAVTSHRAVSVRGVESVDDVGA